MKIAKKCPVKIAIFSPSKIANHNKRPLPFFNNSPTLIYVNTSDKGGILNINSNDLEDILAHALDTIKGKMGESYSIEKVNLAELHRITGISRAKLRRLKKNGFVVKPNANKGKKSKKSVISGYEGTIDDYLRKNVTNSEVIFERLQGVGYPGIRHSSPIHPILHPFQSESKSTYNAQSTSL